MSSIFTSPKDIEDLKKFEGRVLTMLGEIQRMLNNQASFLEDKFYMGNKESPAGYEYDPMDEGDEDD